MIDEIITSKTRVKLLRLFLTHIDDRYYLRELERMLNESLSPLRRQLLRLEKMGILVTEEEANLKYYRLNKNFAGIEDLRKLVLGNEVAEAGKTQPAPKRVKYDIAVLTLISFFILGVATFMVYTNSKNIQQIASLMFEVKPRTSHVRGLTSNMNTTTEPDEMVSKHWKVKAGSFPVLSSGEAGVEKRSEEL